MGQHQQLMPEPRSPTNRSRLVRLMRPIGALPSAPVLATIGILVGLIVAGFVLPLSSPSRPAFPNFGLASPAPEPTSPAESAEPTRRSPPPPASPTARYALDELHDDVFIATVAIGNESDRAAGWTVELAYGGDVGELANFWVDGTLQPSLRRVDDRYVFRGAEDVAPGAEVALNVQLPRSGADIAPTTCLLNGEECLIRH